MYVEFGSKSYGRNGKDSLPIIPFGKLIIQFNPKNAFHLKNVFSNGKVYFYFFINSRKNAHTSIEDPLKHTPEGRKKKSKTQ